ncbi:hypothetical protein BCR43DRAFT_125960 [Syncephalastrum racemosum]|uniref:ER membrane protein complex subunit 7 beta-sandwich domain-containing protein n=1 Tax=Syncephalastrum racemosum TaxID=13706 RepID=A0A1X2HKS2_SYNRA|nr:hypothetical protein BCR43DRAFT_125960 [Syncephalastrum racemosum]
MQRLTTVLLLLTIFWVSLAQATSVIGKLIPNGILDITKLDPSTRAILNGGVYSAPVRLDGSFELRDIAPGSYLLEIESINYIFPKLRVDVKDETVKAAYTALGVNWDSTGYSVSHPFELGAKAPSIYFAERQGFNVLGMFKNPMFLMIGFSGLMMLVLPKMMANMDPEALKEMSQSQADAQKMMSDMPSLAKMLGNAQQPQQQQQQQRQRR